MTYSMVIPYFVVTIAELFVQMRTGFAALERMLEYNAIEQEAPHTIATDPSPGSWPSEGRIEFKGVSLRYRPGLPLALIDFSASIEGRERVGIVGRTGAGKSTLILALFRLVEPAAGTITIDGISTDKLGLQALRRAMTIIPQVMPRSAPEAHECAVDAPKALAARAY